MKNKGKGIEEMTKLVETLNIILNSWKSKYVA